MSNDPAPADTQNLPVEPDDQIEFSADKKSRISARFLVSVVVGLIILNLAAFIFLPPFDSAHPEQSCLDAGGLSETVNCLVNGTLHLPRPHEVWVAGGEAANTGLITFQVSLTDTLVTMLGITAIVALVLILATRGKKDVPGFFQNFAEWSYESLSGWSFGMGGSKAGRYIPIFAAFFILILAFNWSGLIPGIGILPGTRAPTSDLNVTLGLALFAWFYFQFQGFRRLGVGEKEHTTQPLGLRWPRDVYSLAHVALPFAPEDPVYGGPDAGKSPGIQLGELVLRGERGVLEIGASDLLRLRWNPFYPYVEQRVVEALDAIAPRRSATTGSESARNE